MTILSQELSRVAALTDEVLLNECSVLAACTRSTQAKLILLLSEVDERRLYLRHGFSSLHATKSEKSASKIVTSLLKQEVEKGRNEYLRRRLLLLLQKR